MSLSGSAAVVVITAAADEVTAVTGNVPGESVTGGAMNEKSSVSPAHGNSDLTTTVSLRSQL
jgi:hypothetical protein